MTESISRKFSKLGSHVSATGTITTNAATASAWETARTLTLSGDVSGSASISGAHDITLTATVSGNSITLGTDTTGDYVASVAAGTGITATGSGESAAVTVALAASGVTASSYGSSTAVPVLTIDTYGRITSATTASVSSSINIAGDTGTDSVSLISDTLTVAGGTGLSSTVTNNTVTLDIDNTVATLTGAQTLTNKTISGGDNTISNIGNSSLTNSSITINGTSVSLGGTRTLVTDDVAEDASPVNLWFTNTRARGAMSATDAGGDGSFTYDSGTGVFTYTGPSASEVRAHFSAGTGVTISSGQVAIGQAVGTSDNVTFNDVVVSGNLTVSGTTTTINTETINLADNTVVLNSNETGTPSQDAGIEVERGTSSNVTLLWDETNDRWTVGSQNFVAGTFVGALSGNASTVTNGVYTTDTGTVTNTMLAGSIANNKLANSTISGVALGSNLATLTMGVSGTGLSGSQTYNGSGAATFTVTSNATSANTASTIVARDGSGNFTAGTITAALSGNATTATTAGALTSMNISQFTNNSGYITGLSFDGLSSKTGGTGTYTTSGDFRAPIFYDSNDTTFYVNPNSKSELQSLDLGYTSGQVYTTAVQGTLFFNNHGESDIQGYSIGTTLENYNGNYTKLTLDWHTGIKIGAAATYGGIRFYNNSVKYYEGSEVFSVARGDSNVRVENILYVGSDVRSPIFYDSNNTGYYIDPTSTTAIRTVGSWRADSATWDGEFAGKIQYHSSNWYFQYGSEFIFRNGSGSNVTYGDTSGNLWAVGSMRSPVFYDNNDTAFYLNPAGGSRLRNLYVGDSGDDWSDPGGWGTQIRFSNGPHVKFVLHARTPGIEAGMYVHTPSSVFIGSYSSHDVSLMYAGSRKMGFNASYIYTDVYLEAAGSLRAPIFYDSNNTAYYTDPAGTARLSYVVANGGIRIDGNENLYLDYNYGCSIVGAYASTRYQGVFAMGNSYKLPIDGTSTGNLYGIAWSHPNAGGVAGNMSSHGLLVLINGGFGSSMSYNVVASSDVRGTIFYDYNNTGYYVDPNDFSRMGRIDPNEIYNYGWFRNHSDTGWYSQAYGYGAWWAHSAGNSYGNATTYGSGRNGWSGWGIGSRHVFMSTTGDNVGVHDNSRGWIWYWNGSYTEFPYGYTIHGGSSRSPIFYDQNDTAWYTDPNNVSRMYRAHIGNNGTNYAMLTVLGNIGFTSPASYYYLSSGVGYGSYGNGAQGVGLAIYVDDGSRIICAEYMTHSDRRLKDVVNIISENEGLSFIRDIDPVHYRWKNAKIGNEGLLDRELKTGFIAQDVIRNGFRHLVAAVPKEGLPAETDIYGHTSPANEQFTVDYVQMIPYYHAALRNILKKTDDIEILKQQIATQQAKIEELENRINNS
jgi:hypothetical protein